MRFNDVIEIYRAPVLDTGYGTRRDWNNPILILSSPASVLPKWSNENSDVSRELSEIQVNIYCKPVDVTASDRVRVVSTAKPFFGAPFFSTPVNASPPRWFEVFSTPIVWSGRTASYMRITARQVVIG